MVRACLMLTFPAASVEFSPTPSTGGRKRKGAHSMKTKFERGAYAAPSIINGFVIAESRDCAVRALMVAACISYGAAFELLRAAGRKNNKGTTQRQLESAIRAAGFPYATAQWNPITKKTCYMRPSKYVDEHGFILEPATRISRSTVAQFARDNSRGHFVVHVANHFITICDGVVHDWRRSKRTVDYFWKLV